MTNTARRIAFAGSFIALNIVLTRVLGQIVPIAGLPALRLSFGEIPLFLSSIILGPMYGAICGALADLLGFPINPQGPYFPGFTLSAALAGFLPGFMGKLVKKGWTWLSLTIVISITTIIISMILNTLWLSMMFDKAFLVLVPPRIIASLIMIPIYVIVIKLFLKHFRFIIGEPLNESK
ncbi:MAG TPA: folate family ECF transporter S component [Clostridiales bacterium]|nr:folate family ECF transporter S component [Clostridiales bacterium]